MLIAAPAQGRLWHRAAKVSEAVCPQLVKADFLVRPPNEIKQLSPIFRE
jgi:hypothetical protein